MISYFIVFYEKVIKVKADVAAFPNFFLRAMIVTRLGPQGGSRKGGFSGAF